MPDVRNTRVFLKEYRAPAFWVDHTDMEFDLDLDCTTVTTKLSIRRNTFNNSVYNSLILDGDNLKPKYVKVNGRTLGAKEFYTDDYSLTIPDAPDNCTVETQTTVCPKSNTTALGLCPSNDGDIYSQCEAESFRSFAYAMDRPDVLSTYKVILRADKRTYPTLLSNGHLIDAGDLGDGRHWTAWHDPIKKPTFIFAILAGDFEAYKHSFKTMSGRDIAVTMYTRSQYLELCKPSMQFVLDAMKWDEQVFNREYDLDIFNFGILNGFTGAMENKGLNLFDLNWIVAHAKNCTDEEYEYRLKTTAHEYFHNWSGNKVSIRDWFQVSLKEGLTRFRDQLFLADMTEFTPTRIKMCRHIRNNQFTEDDSSVAHPPIWESYIEPRNLFTNTVYDKGQEIIFMLYSILGRDGFCEVVSAFFDEHAGQSVTIEEFLRCFERHGDLDLEQFRRWYYQSGLTELEIDSEYDAAQKTFKVRLKQYNRPTQDKEDKAPHHIPFAVGLLSADGSDMAVRLEDGDQLHTGTHVLELKDHESVFTFKGVNQKPVLSRHRFFSAPVRLIENPSDEDLAFLTAKDTDLFARWDAGQTYAGRVIARLMEDYRAGRAPHKDEQFLTAFIAPFLNENISKRSTAELVTLPDERTVGEMGEFIDVDAVHWAHSQLKRQIAEYGRDQILRVYNHNDGAAPYSNSNECVGRRKIRNAALVYLMSLDDSDIHTLCLNQLTDSENITEQFNALCCLINSDAAEREEGISVFKNRWADDQLGLDKWYRAHAISTHSDAARTINELMSANEFNLNQFGRLFAVCEGFFYLNRCAVNAPDGSGYDTFLKQMLRVNRHTPMLSEYVFARSDLPRWRKFAGWRNDAMRKTVEAIRNAEGVSSGFRDICDKALENVA